MEPQSKSNLSSEGFRRLNEYASGRFEALLEEFDVRPDNPAIFVQRYVEQIQKLATPAV